MAGSYATFLLLPLFLPHKNVKGGRYVDMECQNSAYSLRVALVEFNTGRRFLVLTE